MRTTVRILLGGVLLLAACATEEREWMKFGEKYTAADLKRDARGCTAGGKIDETCMKSKGWVSVSPGRTDKPQEQPTRGSGTPRR